MSSHSKSKSKEPTKRSVSPLASKTLSTQRKKKPSVSSNLGVDYMLEYNQALNNKSDRKKTPTILNNPAPNGKESSLNKYRILTEPVESHSLHHNIFGNSSFSRMPLERRTKKLTTQIGSSAYNNNNNLPEQHGLGSSSDKKVLKIHVKTHNNSSLGGNMYSNHMSSSQYNPPHGASSKQRGNHLQSVSGSHECKNCAFMREHNARLVRELQSLRNELARTNQVQAGWRSAKITLHDVRNELLAGGHNNFQAYAQTIKNSKSNSIQVSNSSQAVLGKDIQSLINSSRKALNELKKSLVEVMSEYQNLAKLDFKQMMKAEVFSYDTFDSLNVDTRINEAKQLLDTLKGQWVGHAAFDTPPAAQRYREDSTDIDEEINELMARNLKSRLNQALRQNLQLKVKNEILRCADTSRTLDEEYVREAIRDVLDER